VRRALDHAGQDSAAPDWLATEEAVDIPFTGPHGATIEAAARAALSGLAIDVIAQSARQRKKKLIVADMDSTIISGETLDELAAFAGLKEQISALTARAMNGEIGFVEALNTRVALLRGLDESSLDETLCGLHLNPGARELIATMRHNGAYAALVSGGFTFFTERIRAQVGFDMALGNQLEIHDGRLTGEVIPPLVDKTTKLDVLIDLAAQRNLTPQETLSIGDGANDVAMLKAAGMGIAYHAHPVARKQARACLDHADLTGALYIQGYHRDEFITP